MKKILAILLLTISVNAAAQTRNFVPRATGEGNIGLSTKPWGGVYSGTVTAVNAYITGSITTSSFTATGNGQFNGSAFSVGGSTLVVSGGKVGIGTTAPGQKLTVAGNISLTDGGVIGSTTTDGLDKNSLYLSGGGADGIGSARGGYILMYGNDHTTYPGNLILGAGNETGGDIRFYNDANLERMRILKSGNVGIGNINPSTKLHISSGTLTVDGTGATITTSGNVIMTGGYIRSYSRTMAQLLAITPGAEGSQYYCSDCTPKKIVVSTGTAAGNFAAIDGGTFQ